MIATHARPIPRRAVRPPAPLPPLEVVVPAHLTDPVALARLPFPILVDLPSNATHAP